MAKIEVWQSVEGNFLGEHHPKDEIHLMEDWVRVATLHLPDYGDPLQLAEAAYEMTQTLASPWYERPLPLLEVHESPARSSAVGDVFVVDYGDDHRIPIMIDVVGWIYL